MLTVRRRCRDRGGVYVWRPDTKSGCDERGAAPRDIDRSVAELHAGVTEHRL